ncbi:MAG: alpha/beta fold hydrolase, partial [Myxococcales bacterium]|nr:alpha/beta fold hydrolase [Myxococcales bacterium]
AAADRYREENVTVGGPPYPLPGTLTLPSPGPPGGAPALVPVHGSGPQDRDTTLGPNKPFADLALGLASRGIAVLRYDKRTKVHGQAIARAVANGEPFTLREETVEDALAAAALLRGHAAIDPDRVFVLGHSLGGTAIPRIAAGDAEIAGFVLLAAASERLEDAIVRQHRYIAELDGQLSDEERALLEKSEALAREVKALRDPAAGPIHGIPAGYWLDLAAHPPLHEIASVRRPLLVLQGGRDYQVTDAAFASWREALASHPRATFTRYPTLNHLFIAGEGPSRPEEYLKPGHVAEAVIDDIAAFVSGGAKRGP